MTENDQIELIHRCHHDGNQTNRETKFNHHLIVNPQNSPSPKVSNRLKKLKDLSYVQFETEKNPKQTKKTNLMKQMAQFSGVGRRIR